MIGVGCSKIHRSRVAALDERAGDMAMVNFTKSMTQAERPGVLEPVLVRRDGAIIAWFTRVHTQFGEWERRLLALAQRGLTREQLVAQLGDARAVDDSMRAIVGSLDAVEAGGGPAVQLGIRTVRVCLARLPAFAGIMTVGARPGLLEILLASLERPEDAS